MAHEEFPVVAVVDVIPSVDVSDSYAADRFAFYSDGSPVIDQNRMLERMKAKGIAKDSTKYAINTFVENSPNPELMTEIAENFMYSDFGYNIQSGVGDAPLIIRSKVQKVGSDDELTVVELSPATCDQFVGMFLSELTIFPPFEQELEILSDLAIRSYSEGAFVVALYDHLLTSRWLGTENPQRDFLRYTRVAKKLMTELIGENEFSAPDSEVVMNKLAGGIAYRRMMERLRANEYFYGGPFEERIHGFRGKLALRAIRATQDDFFIGVASPLSDEEQEAYIKTAASMPVSKKRNRKL